MYVEDVEDGKRTYRHIYANNFLNIQPIFQSTKSFGKLRLRAFQPYHQILCILKHVKDVKDRSNAPKGCNAMYVEDGKRTYRHIYANNFLNIQPIFNPQKVLESWDLELSNHTIKYCLY